jgi:hypothetical protein
MEVGTSEGRGSAGIISGTTNSAAIGSLVAMRLAVVAVELGRLRLVLLEFVLFWLMMISSFEGSSFMALCRMESKRLPEEFTKKFPVFFKLAVAVGSS